MIKLELRDRPEYRQFMAGAEIPGESEIPEALLEDVSTLISRECDQLVSPSQCRLAVALVVWVSRHGHQ